MNIKHDEPVEQLRAKEYPPIGDQLDELWKLIAQARPDLAQGSAVFQKIQEVKTKYKIKSNQIK